MGIRTRRPRIGANYGFNIYDWPTKEDLALICNVTPRTVTNWLQEGKLPAPSTSIHRGQYRWHPQVIEDWVNSRCPSEQHHAQDS